MQHGVHSSQQSTPESHHKTPATHDPALSDEVLVQRALDSHESADVLSPAVMRALNRTVGNQAVQRWIQREVAPISQAPAATIQRDPDDDIVEHGYDKHVLGVDNGTKGKEFGDPPISKEDYKAIATGVRTNGASKVLARGRTAYWKGGVIVIINANDSSKSTCFKASKSYFDRQT